MSKTNKMLTKETEEIKQLIEGISTKIKQTNEENNMKINGIGEVVLKNQELIGQHATLISSKGITISQLEGKVGIELKTIKDEYLSMIGTLNSKVQAIENLLEEQEGGKTEKVRDEGK